MLFLDAVKSMYKGTVGTLDVIIISLIRSLRSTLLLLTQ